MKCDELLSDFPTAHKRQLARATATGVELLAYPGGNSYMIEWWRLSTPMKALRWVYHLADKLWMSPQMLKEFIEVVMQHFKWPWGTL